MTITSTVGASIIFDSVGFYNFIQSFFKNLFGLIFTFSYKKTAALQIGQPSVRRRFCAFGLFSVQLQQPLGVAA